MAEISEAELERRAEMTVSRLGGIQSPHKAFYVLSMRYCFERAKAAFQQYDQLSYEKEDPSRIIAAAQEAISHTAALSRFFFPSRLGPKNHRRSLRFARAEKLREQFSVSDDSPLADKELRNMWEHFDDRLDEFLLSNDAGMFYPMPLHDSHTLADDPIGKIFKLIDTKEHCLVLLNKKFFIGPLRAELHRIFEDE